MGTSILYITSADADTDRQIDLESVAETLCLENIISASSKETKEGGCTQYAYGTHSKQLLNYNFQASGSQRVSEFLEDSVRAFEDLRFFVLPHPVPIPIMTHEYPVYCPECKDPIDDTFQAQLSQIKPSFFDGVAATHPFVCDSCEKSFPLSALLKRGGILHRRNFVEIYDICCVSKKPDLLSEPVREVLEEAFGPIALRHGWLT
jgi:hypothetical protein